LRGALDSSGKTGGGFLATRRVRKARCGRVGKGGVKSSTSNARNQKRSHHSKHSAGGGHGACALLPALRFCPPHRRHIQRRRHLRRHRADIGVRAVRFFKSAFAAASRSGGALSRIVPDPAPDLSDPAYQTHLCDWRGFSRWWLFAQIPDLRNLALRFLASFE
jgi:hypothetical protein